MYHLTISTPDGMETHHHDNFAHFCDLVATAITEGLLIHHNYDTDYFNHIKPHKTLRVMIDLDTPAFYRVAFYYTTHNMQYGRSATTRDLIQQAEYILNLTGYSLSDKQKETITDLSSLPK